MTITAMETSKFWKLRTLWFTVKTRVKLFVSLGYTARLFQPRGSRDNSDFLIDEIPARQQLVKHSATVDIIVCLWEQMRRYNSGNLLSPGDEAGTSLENSHCSNRSEIFAQNIPK